MYLIGECFRYLIFQEAQNVENFGFDIMNAFAAQDVPVYDRNIADCEYFGLQSINFGDICQKPVIRTLINLCVLFKYPHIPSHKQNLKP